MIYKNKQCCPKRTTIFALNAELDKLSQTQVLVFAQPLKKEAARAGRICQTLAGIEVIDWIK